MSYFMKIYNEKIFWDLYYNLKIKNIMNIPKMHKIVINSSCGNFFLDKKKMSLFYKKLYFIFLQKPIFIKCKKSISNFKLKKGDNISLKITLRSKKMYDFFYKFLILIKYNFKKFKRFTKNSMDSFGNYNIGINNCSIFLENNDLEFVQGFNISIVLKNSNILKSLELLKFLKFPLN